MNILKDILLTKSCNRRHLLGVIKVIMMFGLTVEMIGSTATLLKQLNA